MVKNTNNNWINNHLRFALSNANHKSENEITKEYLSTLKELNLSDKDIGNLDGIQFAINLTSLNLSKNRIQDATHLRNLAKLTNLELSENRIEDVSFLVDLKKLRSIGLDCNNISIIPKLSELKNLTLINISNNKVQDISFIKDLRSNNIKVIASEQCILLNPVSIHYGEDYTFEPIVIWDSDNSVFYDNIQVTGKYKSIETDERPSLLYSISKILIRNICSNCIIKADFYHEVPFLKSGILSGILIQPLSMKLTNKNFTIDNLKKEITLGSIFGKLILNQEKNTLNKNIFLKNKVITLINSDGVKLSHLTNDRGEYKFSDLQNGRYTILFPFINGCNYTTQSLYLVNIESGEDKEINATVDIDLS